MRHRSSFEQWVTRCWYQKPAYYTFGLWPFAWVYGWGVKLRRYILEKKIRWRAPVPVVIVGNITVGGVGKTPLVAAIAHHYTQAGWQVGIVSRGYGAKQQHFPFEVFPDACPLGAGDEPVLLARKTGCPVMIDPKRSRAVQALLNRYALDLIISDDGLQHYALARNVEIAVLDAMRGVGNGRLLPAGPLREPPQRLSEVDFLVVNGDHNKSIEKPIKKYTMQMVCQGFKALRSDALIALADFKPKVIHAVTGIGHPDRFFNALRALGLTVHPHVFPDHHVFQPQDLAGLNGCIVMTEKDALKCASFAKNDWYSLQIDATLEDAFWAALTTRIRT